jgi:hypothetical protein
VVSKPMSYLSLIICVLSDLFSFSDKKNRNFPSKQGTCPLMAATVKNDIS